MTHGLGNHVVILDLYLILMATRLSNSQVEISFLASVAMSEMTSMLDSMHGIINSLRGMRREKMTQLLMEVGGGKNQSCSRRLQ